MSDSTMNKDEQFCQRCKIVYGEGYKLHQRICRGYNVILDLPDKPNSTHLHNSEKATDVRIRNIENMNKDKTNGKANSMEICTENGVNSELKCDTCGFTFKSKASLIGHVTVCGLAGPSGVNTRRKLACMHVDCDASFYCKTAILSHLSETHRTRVDAKQLLKFEDIREFRRWKKTVEKETRNDFVERKSSKGATYYYCQKDSPEWTGKTSTITSKDDKCLNKAQKSCIAFMKVLKKKTSVIVHYYPTHSHEVIRKRARKYTERDIKKLIIANNLTDETMDKKLVQVDQATVKRITDSEYAEYDMYAYNRYEPEFDAALYGDVSPSEDDSGCSSNNAERGAGPEASEMQVKKVRQSLSRLTDMFRTGSFPSQLVQHADFVLKDLLRGLEMLPNDVEDV